MDNVEFKFPLYSIVKHVKTGNEYFIEMACLIEKDKIPAYAYSPVGKYAPVWIRPKDEMEDGRFELVSRHYTEVNE